MAKLFRWIAWPPLFFSLTASFGAPMTKFEWQASDSGPKGYPTEIVSGALFYHDGSGSLYVPNKAELNRWGEGRSTHLVGPDLKPLPNRLSITFFSYTENQFYSGKFDLPYDMILKLFQDGYYSPREKDHATYRQIVTGVAPGGAVAVWLVGVDKTTEVFFGQAEKTDIEWSQFTNATDIPRDEYVRSGIQESLKTPQAVEALRKNGVPFGLWNRYRTRYLWQPVFAGMVLRDGIIKMVDYFNGEYEHLDYPLDKTIAANSRPVPKQINFVWMAPGVPKGRNIEIYFNEAEIFAAFKKLGGDNQPLHLEVRPGFSVWLLNDQEKDNDKNKVELKLTEVKNYGI